jgi:hypothetical protein
MTTKRHAIRVSPAMISRMLVVAAVLAVFSTASAQEIVEGLENAYRYAPTDYESKLRDANIQGRVTAEVVVDTDGFPIEARIVEGPMNQLRRHVLRSVMDWRWARPEKAPQTVRVVVDFKLGQPAAPTPAGLFRPGPRGQGLASHERRAGLLTAIDMSSLRDRLRLDLEARLPVRAGQRLTGAEWPAAQRAAKAVDEWLDLKVEDRSNGLVLRIFYPRYQPHGQALPPPPPPPPPRP